MITYVEKGKIIIYKIPEENQTADIRTKPLGTAPFLKFRQLVNLFFEAAGLYSCLNMFQLIFVRKIELQIIS